MEKKYYFYKMYPPRPTFHLDQNQHEMKIMQQHMQYWKEQKKMDRAIIYGPVFDPNGVYGMAIITAIDEEDAEKIAQNDLAIILKLCNFDLVSMNVGS